MPVSVAAIKPILLVMDGDAELRIWDDGMEKRVIKAEFGVEGEVPVGMEGDFVIRTETPDWRAMHPAYIAKLEKTLGIEPNQGIEAIRKIHQFYSRGNLTSFNLGVLVGRQLG